VTWFEVVSSAFSPRAGRAGPNTHFFSEDTGRDVRVLQSLIAAHQPDRLYPGHGGVLRTAAAASLTGSPE